MVEEITSEDFDNKINKKKSLVYFHADWCGPCKVFSPIIENASEMFKDINFYEIDTDKNIDIVSKYKVMSIPTIIYFNDGLEKDRSTGAIPFNSLVEFLSKAV